MFIFIISFYSLFRSFCYWHGFSFVEIDSCFFGTSFQFLFGQEFAQRWSESFDSLLLQTIVKFLAKTKQKTWTKSTWIRTNSIDWLNLRRWREQLAHSSMDRERLWFQLQQPIAIFYPIHRQRNLSLAPNLIRLVRHTVNRRWEIIIISSLNIFVFDLFRLTSRPDGSASFRIWHTTNFSWASWLPFKWSKVHDWMRLATHSFGPWWHSNSLPSGSRLFARPNGTRFSVRYGLKSRYSRPSSAISARLSGQRASYKIVSGN